MEATSCSEMSATMYQSIRRKHSEYSSTVSLAPYIPLQDLLPKLIITIMQQSTNFKYKIISTTKIHIQQVTMLATL